MKIIIDTREQKPLKFKFPYVTKALVRKLDVGDYGCEYEDGYVPSVYFERKNLTDLFGTLGKGHKRFKREIERAANNGNKLIMIIEGSMTRVREGAKYSTIDGITIIRQLMMLQIKYDLDFQFFHTRYEMEEYIYEYYSAIGRLKGKRTSEYRKVHKDL